MSPPQSRSGSSRTAPPDQSSQAGPPSRKSPQAACPHQKSRIDPSYPHPRILLCGLESHKFRKGRYFSSCPYDKSGCGDVQPSQISVSGGARLMIDKLENGDVNEREAYKPHSPPQMERASNTAV